MIAPGSAELIHYEQNWQASRCGDSYVAVDQLRSFSRSFSNSIRGWSPPGTEKLPSESWVGRNRIVIRKKKLSEWKATCKKE